MFGETEFARTMVSRPPFARPPGRKGSEETINKRSDDDMDKDRIAGAAKEAKGAVKETVGKALGDTKLQADGKSDKVEGKVQNAVGGLKDALKE